MSLISYFNSGTSCIFLFSLKSFSLFFIFFIIRKLFKPNHHPSIFEQKIMSMTTKKAETRTRKRHRSSGLEANDWRKDHLIVKEAYLSKKNRTFSPGQQSPSQIHPESLALSWEAKSPANITSKRK